VACLAVHGMKRRWAAATVRDGLTRESAAWFVQPAGADDAGLERTLAAAAFLALAPATRTRLAAATGAGAYREFFARAGDLLPALLLFSDEPTGQETWHRYLWPGPPGPGSTYPYTKVARAGRQVGFAGRRVHVVTVDPPMLAHAETMAEAGLAGRGCGPAGPGTELTRLAGDALEPAIPPGAGSGKLHRVCAGLAGGIAAGLRPHVAWIRGHGLAGDPP
jgi:hypothetical protein